MRNVLRKTLSQLVGDGGHPVWKDGGKKKKLKTPFTQTVRATKAYDVTGERIKKKKKPNRMIVETKSTRGGRATRITVVVDIVRINIMIFLRTYIYVCVFFFFYSGMRIRCTLSLHRLQFYSRLCSAFLAACAICELYNGRCPVLARYSIFFFFFSGPREGFFFLSREFCAHIITPT